MLRYFVFTILAVSLLAVPTIAFAQDKVSVRQVTINKMDEYLQYTKGQKRLFYIYRSTDKKSRNKMRGIMDLERAKKGSVIAISVDENHIKFAQFIKNYMRNSPFHILLLRAKEGAFRKMMVTKYGAAKWVTGGVMANGQQKKTSYPIMILFDEENNIVKQGGFEVEEVAEFLFSIAPPKDETKEKKKSFLESLFSF